MNSDEETRLFSRWGWEYDFVARCWLSPVNPEVKIKTDDLVAQASRALDADLHLVAIKYGWRPPDDRL